MLRALRTVSHWILVAPWKRSSLFCLVGEDWSLGKWSWFTFFYCNYGEDRFYRNTFIGSSQHKLCPEISWLPFFLPSSLLHGAPSYTHHGDVTPMPRSPLLTSPPPRNYVVRSPCIGWEVGGIEFTLSLHKLTFCPWEKYSLFLDSVASTVNYGDNMALIKVNIVCWIIAYKHSVT